MATTTAKPRQRAADPIPERERGPRHVHLAARCYLGLVMVVALTIAATKTMPAGVSIPLFIAGMAIVVLLAHPQVHLTRRR